MTDERDIVYGRRRDGQPFPVRSVESFRRVRKGLDPQQVGEYIGHLAFRIGQLHDALAASEKERDRLLRRYGPDMPLTDTNVVRPYVQPGLNVARYIGRAPGPNIGSHWDWPS